MAEEALPEGQLFRVLRPFWLSLDNSNLIIVIGMSQPEDIRLQRIVITVYIDTSLGERKDLAILVISGLCLTHRLCLRTLTRPSTVK